MSQLVTTKTWVKQRAYRLWVRSVRILRESVIVLGDSHANVFKHKLLRCAYPGYVFEVVSVRGATASGLDNPNAVTQAYPIFTREIERSSSGVVVFLLGEVDTGFIIWYRAQKYGSSVDDMLKLALENYQNMLLEVRERCRVICISAPLPTIRDGQDWGEVANERRSVKATQRERTELTLEFNNAMESFCAANDMDFISLDGRSLGEDGLVAAQLLNEKATNHHYDPAKYAKIIRDAFDDRALLGAK